jgi:S-DNA-T family DNA segregation ATPase FtsK/SpoIIIE
MAKKDGVTKQNNVSNVGKIQGIKSFFSNERTRFVSGLILMILTLYMFGFNFILFYRCCRSK